MKTLFENLFEKYGMKNRMMIPGSCPMLISVAIYIGSPSTTLQ
jgi:hypothetical protein